VMFQVYVETLDTVLAQITAWGWPVHTALREVWRRHGDREGGQREVFVQDPNGYLVMVAQSLGERRLSLTPEPGSEETGTQVVRFRAAELESVLRDALNAPR